MENAKGRGVLVLVFLGYRKIGYRRRGVKGEGYRTTDDGAMIHVSSDPNETLCMLWCAYGEKVGVGVVRAGERGCGGLYSVEDH